MSGWNNGTTCSLSVCSLFALGLDKVDIKHSSLERRTRILRDDGGNELSDGPGEQPFWDTHPSRSSSTTSRNRQTLTFDLIQHPISLLIKTETETQ